ncbi:MAG: UDP-N-acetylmuramoyl-L-alanine--D-glutamate ligase [Rhizobiaceae bacterium]|nr:UDP-N-acetylmuramoyl-L-alanine--D-glutamate ligase [Rhizobiaceae bacterium]
MSIKTSLIPAGAANVALWGFGREGRATLDFLAQRHPQAKVTLVSDGTVPDAPDGIEVLTGEAGSAELSSGAFDVIIKSPGISLYRPEVAGAQASGTLVTSATNLWFEAWPGALTVAITGTKGKSTTSSLVHHLFGLAGWRSKLMGNVGRAMIAETPGDDVTVLELSSYQIADLAFAPSLALVTNLHPEHGPWHHGHENYYRDKMRLVTLDDSVPVAVNATDGRVAAYVAGRPNVRSFETADGFHVKDDGVCLGETRLDIRNLGLRGRHNLVNLAGAFTLLDMAGAFQPGRIWDFSRFTPLPHRLQELQLANGALAVNDSISTIPETTRAALDVHGGQPFRLLVGGVDRGQDFNALFQHLATLPTLKMLYLLKGNGGKLGAMAAIHGLPFKGPYAAFDQAVADALADSMAGETLVLSPGAASQEEFADFEKRGERFLALCGACL